MRNGYEIEQLAQELDSPRLAELFYPLVSVCPPSVVKDVLDFAKQLQASRLSELSLSEDAQVLSAVLTCHDCGEVENGKIAVKNVRAVVNETLDLNEQRSSHHIGKIINRLGFERCKVHGGYAALFWSQELIDRLSHDPRYKECFTDRELRVKLHEERKVGEPEEFLDVFP